MLTTCSAGKPTSKLNSRNFSCCCAKHSTPACSYSSNTVDMMAATMCSCCMRVTSAVVPSRSPSDVTSLPHTQTQAAQHEPTVQATSCSGRAHHLQRSPDTAAHNLAQHHRNRLSAQHACHTRCGGAFHPAARVEWPERKQCCAKCTAKSINAQLCFV